MHELRFLNVLEKLVGGNVATVEEKIEPKEFYKIIDTDLNIIRAYCGIHEEETYFERVPETECGVKNFFRCANMSHHPDEAPGRYSDIVPGPASHLQGT